jgi:NitT/TauT family transport system substrate-binding protein
LGGYAGAAALFPRAAFAQDPSLTQLVLASAPDDDVTPALYADKAGWFRAAGIGVRIDRLNNGSAVAAAVVGGAVNIGKVSLLPIVFAHARGVPLTIVAPGVVMQPNILYAGMLVRKDSDIHTARDLNGKTVSVPALNDLQALAGKTWIDQNGGDSKQVSFVEEPVVAVGTGFDSGRLSAGLLTNPALGEDLASGKYRNLGRPIEAISSHLMTSAWVCTTDWATKNPDAVRRFGQIIAKAGAYANAHHAETIALIAAFSGIEPSTLATMPRAVFPTTLNVANVQPLIEVAARYGAIQQRFNALDLFSPLAAAPVVK